ncbi:hypothetical protein ACFLY2_00125 [Patescibacteria group bacterium]
MAHHSNSGSTDKIVASSLPLGEIERGLFPGNLNLSRLNIVLSSGSSNVKKYSFQPDASYSNV